MSHVAHAPRPARHPVKVAVQVFGFLVGLGLLVWCIRGALSDGNQAQIGKLLQADPRLVAGVLGLSAMSLVLNGLIFWNAVRPVKKLSVLDVQGTHAVSVLLGYLPFKLGLLFRILVHNRRDGVPLLTIGAWFASITMVMGAVIVPLVGVSVWRGKLDVVWVIVAGVSLLAMWSILFILARTLAGPAGLQRLRLWLSSLGSGAVAGKIRESHAVSHLHAGFDMLAHPGALACGVFLRVADVSVQAARFAVAARILEIELSTGQAILVSLAYFVLGIISPAGMLGAREAGTKGALVALDVTGGKGFAVVLLVSAAEVLIQLPAALGGVLRLRVWKGIRMRSQPAGGAI